MTNAWTKGPWEHSHRKTFSGMYSTQVYDTDGETIADVAWYPVHKGKVTTTSREANACLIAAAPDMAEALQGAMVCIDMVSWPGDEGSGVRASFGKRRDAILAALAKARGEAP